MDKVIKEVKYSEMKAEVERFFASILTNVTGRVIEKSDGKTEATVVGLYGDLGAGKTFFTQLLAECLGVSQRVTSPTFVIEKIYKLEHQQFSHLIHIDAYRLEKSTELESLGWESIISDPKNLIIVEWADKVEAILPEGVLRISFEVIDETTRRIIYS